MDNVFGISREMHVHNVVSGCSIVVFFGFKFHACLNELTTRKIMNRNLLNKEKFVCFVTKYVC